MQKRPLDGILPYRMESSAELPSGAGENMFGAWKKVKARLEE